MPIDFIKKPKKNQVLPRGVDFFKPEPEVKEEEKQEEVKQEEEKIIGPWEGDCAEDMSKKLEGVSQEQIDQAIEKVVKKPAKKKSVSRKKAEKTEE